MVTVLEVATHTRKGIETATVHVSGTNTGGNVPLQLTPARVLKQTKYYNSKEAWQVATHTRKGIETFK